MKITNRKSIVRMSSETALLEILTIFSCIVSKETQYTHGCYALSLLQHERGRAEKLIKQVSKKSNQNMACRFFLW